MEGTRTLKDENDNPHFSIHKNESVVLLANYQSDFILINQYREPLDDYILQLPGGGVEEGEKLEEAVIREFQEETGYVCGAVHYLGSMVPAAWRSNEVTHVFYTEEILAKGNQHTEAHEWISVQRLKILDCLSGIKENNIHDSELCYSVLQAHMKGYINIDFST
ncbi:NUDIX domain-containing protein [Pontibacillus yanchengensis]|uniref:NUDIX domain-containing protein n=3 Tax=Pontibacillus yanchengensis TaxID=462910 RepID=A0ACC7VE63_9BACI|nr:NUDIX domain-containing protein [Pontibacillus yanchengensis]MYL52987.1 NUDIX domain-containing protein [Pontibacillus yanchengensis]